MTNPLATIHAVSRLRHSAETISKPSQSAASDDTFAPQLARACERGPISAASSASRGELAPISDFVGASALRLWESRPVEEAATAATDENDGSDQDSADEQQASLADDAAGETPSVSTAQTETPLLSAAPLALRLAGTPVFATETGETGAPASSAARVLAKEQVVEQEADVPPKAEAGETPSPKPVSETPDPGAPASGPARTLAKEEHAGPEAGAPVKQAGLEAGAPNKPAKPEAGVPSKHAEPESGAAGQGGASPAGTSVAPLTQPMTAAAEMNKTAMPDEQNLPSGTAALHLVAEKIASRILPLTHTASSGTGDQVAQVATLTQPGPETVAKAELVTPVTPVDRVEKVAALIASAVVRMRQRGEDDFEVSIRPDQDTEIMLRVNLQNGNAEVQAELRRGDSAAFAANWRELQDRLAQQGLKLAALTSSESQTETAGQQSDASSKRQPEQQQEAAPFGYANISKNPEPARSAGSKTTSSPVRGWETWA